MWAGLDEDERIVLLPPLSYVPFMALVKKSSLVITDSGGLQEETTHLGIPCLTLRENTERPVTLSEGTNRLVRTSEREAAGDRAQDTTSRQGRMIALWDGKAALRIRDHLKEVMA